MAGLLAVEAVLTGDLATSMAQAATALVAAQTAAVPELTDVTIH